MSEQIRVNQLRRSMREQGIDALWVSKPENVLYLSGFKAPEDGQLLILLDRAIIYTDARYTEQVARESELEAFIGRGVTVVDHAKELIRGLRIGIEAHHLSVANYKVFETAWGITPIATMHLVEKLRQIKEQKEIAHIRTAAQIADAAFAAIQPNIQPGKTEREVALELEFEMRRRGAEGIAFEIIVASGERGALPHGVASDKVILDGELITLDFGAKVEGYRSDMTRTIAVGSPTAQLREIYRATARAHQAALAQIKPGMMTNELDRIARSVIEEAGYGKAFVHSLGHSVGLAIHEGPHLSAATSTALEPGHVITVEPGIYLPGIGGVRIEDLVLVTETGHEVLTHAPKEAL